MNFHDIRFPASISFGSVGGPERRTEIVTLASGHEERNSPWAHSRRRYDAGVGVRSLDDIAALIDFFEARHGGLYGFRWKDWSDYKSCSPSKPIDPIDQTLGFGDNQETAFALVKEYRSGESSYHRPISKPVAGSVRVALGGDEKAEGIDFTVDTNTGTLQFTEPPGAGAEVSAGFEFDVPVRFDTDSISISVANFRAGEIPTVPVVEVRT